MAGSPALNSLVVAIASSVLQAQEKIEAAQLDNLLSYFKREPGQRGFFPLTMKVNLPSIRPNAPAGTTDTYHVPYLSVLPYSSLRIKQVDVDFDVSFNSLLLAKTGNEFHLHEEPSETLDSIPSVSIDLGSNKKSNSFAAHVRLSMENAELPEGTSRLINELIKANQVYELPGQQEQQDEREEKVP